VYFLEVFCSKGRGTFRVLCFYGLLDSNACGLWDPAFRAHPHFPRHDCVASLSFPSSYQPLYLVFSPSALATNFASRKGGRGLLLSPSGWLRRIQVSVVDRVGISCCFSPSFRPAQFITIGCGIGILFPQILLFPLQAFLKKGGMVRAVSPWYLVAWNTSLAARNTFQAYDLCFLSLSLLSCRFSSCCTLRPRGLVSESSRVCLRRPHSLWRALHLPLLRLPAAVSFPQYSLALYSASPLTYSAPSPLQQAPHSPWRAQPLRAQIAVRERWFARAAQMNWHSLAPQLVQRCCWPPRTLLPGYTRVPARLQTNGSCSRLVGCMSGSARSLLTHTPPGSSSSAHTKVTLQLVVPCRLGIWRLPPPVRAGHTAALFVDLVLHDLARVCLLLELDAHSRRAASSSTSCMARRYQIVLLSFPPFVLIHSSADAAAVRFAPFAGMPISKLKTCSVNGRRGSLPWAPHQMWHIPFCITVILFLCLVKVFSLCTRASFHAWGLMSNIWLLVCTASGVVNRINHKLNLDYLSMINDGP